MSCGSVCRVNGTPNYRAVLDFGSACNVANPPNGTFLPTVNDSLQLSIAVRVENHPYLLTTSPTNWVGAGLTTGNGLLWLGAQSLTAKSGYADYGVNATVSLPSSPDEKTLRLKTCHLSLPRHCARVRNSQDGISSLCFFNSAVS